jgi:hypothetical protein
VSSFRPGSNPSHKETAAKAKKKRTPIDHAAIDAKRAKVYGEMENSVCDLSRAAVLAMTVFDNDRLFLFAVGQLDFMVQRFTLVFVSAQSAAWASASHPIPDEAGAS